MEQSGAIASLSTEVLVSLNAGGCASEAVNPNGDFHTGVFNTEPTGRGLVVNGDQEEEIRHHSNDGV